MVVGPLTLRHVRVVCQCLFLSSSLSSFLLFFLSPFLPFSLSSSLFLSSSLLSSSLLPTSTPDFFHTCYFCLLLFRSFLSLLPLPGISLAICGTLTCARAPNADVTGAAVESIQMLELTHALAALEGCDEQSRVGAGGGDGKWAVEGQATCLFRLICSSQVSSACCAPVPCSHPSSVYLPCFP